MTSNFPLSIDVDETVSNVFSSLSISSPSNFRCRSLLPSTLDGEISGVTGVGTPIGAGEGSVRPFRSDSGVNAGNRHRSAYYSSVGQTSPLTVDPHLHHHHPLWRNREAPVRSSVFDQYFDFDQSSDLLLKEQHLYGINPHLICSSKSHDEPFVNDDGKLSNHQIISLLSLKELRGMIHALAKDQNGCRLLQAKFENPTNEEIEFVLTRAMQKLLENLTDPGQIALAMAALRPGAARLANDPNGHHVIQYCLIHFPGDVNEPILNEIADKCYEVATDRSGCCVLQACVEHSHGKVRNRLVAEILRNAVLLAEDPYGNYVLQHMVGLKVAEFTARLVRQLQGNFASLSCNKYASNVVEKCLNESGEVISRQIVMELITCSNPSLLLIDPYGNFVIQSALTVSKGYVYERLLELISDNMSSMRTNLYGKKILAWFEKRRILAI
ncbi:hypothetical protein SSX86_001917 [Deinandra increscens subsp. villosa]|uniref:PUM-HD domain-containing protein n=1 Tax=Deinandra increscens subsp. villosa TaxID=3103831 RepID=A0AAP0DSK4_9ASTR